MIVIVKCNLFRQNSEAGKSGVRPGLSPVTRFEVESREDLATRLGEIWSESTRYADAADAYPDGPYEVEWTSRADGERIVKLTVAHESPRELAATMWAYPES
jgi:hypothetical protein